MRIEEALERFTTQLEADGRSPHTIAQYRRHVRLFAHWARDVRPRCARVEMLDHEAVARFLASDLATGRAGGGVKKATSTNCLRSSLRTFLAYCFRAGYIAQDPGRLIRRARCSPPPPRSISEADQRRLLAVLAKARGPEAERDHLLVHLMLRTGIRIGSAVALDREDVDLARGELRLRTAKGNAPDVVMLGKQIRQHLLRYVAKRDGGPLFTGRGGKRVSVRHVQRRLAQWLRSAGVTQPVSAHSLRHAFAMRVYAKSSDVLLVKAALLHRSIASTLVYARVDGERLRRGLA